MLQSLAKQGREVNNIEQLVQNHLPLARSCAAKFAQVGQRAEDTEAYSDALLGLFKAAQTYNVSRGEFSTWAVTIIKNTMAGEFKTRSRQQQIKTVWENSLSEKDKERYYAKFTEKNSRIMLHQMLEFKDDDSCKLRQNKRMVSQYLDGVSMAEIGRRFGFTRERIRQRIDELTAMLRKRHSKQIGDCVSEEGTLG